MGLINQSVYPNSMTAPYESRTYSEWMSEDPVIIADKFVYDKTYKTFRIGDGTSKFSELNWFVSSRVPEDIIGIEWDRESTTPTLRRIDRLGNDITLTAADFDYHQIYGNMKRVELNSSGQVIATGNGRGDGLTLTNDYIMVQIPKVYYKHVRVDALGNEDAAGRYERILISPYPIAGFVLHNAFYQRGHLSTPPDHIYIGAYTGIISSTKLLSKSGVTSTVEQTMTAFETAAVTNGTGFGIMDIHTLSLLKMLFVVEYASWNSQAVLGNGNVGSSAQLNTGSTNANLASNGTWGTTANQTSGMCWRGIENFWGNIWQFIIGFNGYTDKYRIINPDGSGTYAATLAEGSYIEHTTPTPIWYSNAQGGTLSGTAANGYAYGYIKDFLFTEQTKNLFIPSLLGGSDSTYIPDYFYSVNPTNQPTIYIHGGGWSSALVAGAFLVYLATPVSNVSSYVGARLLYL